MQTSPATGPWIEGHGRRETDRHHAVLFYVSTHLISAYASFLILATIPI